MLWFFLLLKIALNITKTKKNTMQILRAENVVSIKGFIEKSIGSIVFYSNVAFDNLNAEKIRVYVDRNGKDNKQITKSEVSLKAFILACTYGTDAITSFPLTVGEAFDTVAVLELIQGGAIKLTGNDKLRFELTHLDLTKIYVLDGLEEPVELEPEYAFEFEDKQMLADSKVIDFPTQNFDVVVIQDDNSINEIQYTYTNGRTCTYSRRELRAMSQDLDPIAYVKKSGYVATGFLGLLQLPLTQINSLTIKKTEGTKIDLLFRQDLTKSLEANPDNY